MDRLKRLVLDSEDEIVRRARGHAGKRGYNQHMPALEEEFRADVGVLSAGLIVTFDVEGDVRPLSVESVPADDPASALGARLARRCADAVHDPVLLVGLLKCYRSAYLELVSSATPTVDEVQRVCASVSNFFDRVEAGCVAICRNADASGPSTAAPVPSGERDRYLATFSSLPLPAIIIDGDGYVEHANAAAAPLLGSLGAPRRFHLRDAADREVLPVLAREIEEFRSSTDAEKSFDRELRTGKGTRYFQVRFTRIPTAEGTLAGVLVVLNDITYRRNAEEALRRSQAQYIALFENMPIAFIRMRVLLDHRNRPTDHTVLEVNPAFETMSEASASAFVGRPVTGLLKHIGATDPEWMDAFGRVVLTGESAAFDARIGKGDQWVSVTAFSPSPGQVALMMADITGVKAVERALSRSRDFYLSLLEGLPSLVWRAGPDGRIDFVNAAWLELTGTTADGAVGDGWLTSVHPEDRDRRRAALRAAAEQQEPFDLEYRILDSCGEYRWVQESARPFEGLDGRFAGLIGMAVDVAGGRRRGEVADRIATDDALTGLPNAHLFETTVARAVAHAHRGHDGTVMRVGIDGFRHLNEVHGRAAGDVTLRRTAELVRTMVRADDLVARVGPGDFGVLMLDTPLSAARRTAQRLLDGAQEAAAGPGGAPVPLSVGLAEIGGDVDQRMLMSRAESAMCRAREAGGSRVMVYGAGPAALHEGPIPDALERALSGGNGLVLHYQPVVRVPTGEVLHAEALVRLVGPDGRLILPGGFLSAAEAFGYVPRLTRWTVRRALDDLSAAPDLDLTLNLFVESMHDATLLDDAAAWAEAAGVQPARISFEMPEEHVLADLETASRWSRSLHEYGFGFGLDHVGVGHTSLAYLNSLHVDRLVVDGSVMRSCADDPRKQALLEAVQAVSSALGAHAIAGCVENERMLACAREAGIDAAFGYHFGRPAAALPAQALLSGRI